MNKIISGIKKLLKKIPIISVLVSGWQLATNGFANDTAKSRRKQQWKIVFHTFFNPVFAKQWFEFLKSNDFLIVALNRPRLYIKPFRAFISIKWNKKQKLKVILDTYQFIKSKEDVLGQVLTHKEGKTIADINFDNNTKGFLILGYDYRFRKEGELVLTLECSEIGGKIISAAFSFEETSKGNWSCIVGCIQGYNTINKTNGAFKATQKLLHGFRPNSFITYSVQELSRHLGCAAIYCTGNSIQAYRMKHALNLPIVHGINFNYDKFWCEVGGRNIGKGWFELPLTPVRKNIQEVESHKRSMYRKRYDMLDKLSLKISETVKA